MDINVYSSNMDLRKTWLCSFLIKRRGRVRREDVALRDVDEKWVLIYVPWLCVEVQTCTDTWCILQ